MASSRGRTRLAEKPPKKYVFGSSTPRELSHISVPPVFRAIDSKSQKEIAARSHSSASVMATSLLMTERPKVNLAYYVRKAHHSQPPPKISGTHSVKSFAFGSSTPREFSHLNRILPSLRVYDAKIPKKKDSPSKSLTLDNRKMRSASNNHRQKNERVEDDISSEPDIVQYRHYEFLNSLAERKNAKLEAEEETIETELAQELATEARQPVSVVKEVGDELSRHDEVRIVPVVEAHEVSNPVLNEDHQVFEEQSVVKSLGNLQDVASSLMNDAINGNSSSETIVLEPKDGDEVEALSSDETP